MAPHILLVDDEAADLDYVRRAFEAHASVDLKHPQDVVEDDLARATLVLVDYEMRYWEERYEQPSASMQPQNGLALAAVYRSFARERFDRPLAVALYSARLSELSKIPSETRPHVLASLTSLEWVFPKVPVASDSRDDELDVLARRVAVLAQAVEALPPAWPVDADAVRDQVEELLDVPQGGVLGDRCWNDIVRCRPPMYEMSSASHGMWFLDWLLHEILPYSTFLLDSMALAAKLKITPSVMSAVLADTNAVSSELAAIEYGGVLQEFDDRRWWSQGVSVLIERLRSNDGQTHIGELVATAAGVDDVFAGDDPVVCYGQSLGKLPDLYERADSIAIAPDLWPVFAARAYAPRSLHEDPGIQALAKRAASLMIVRTDVRS